MKKAIVWFRRDLRLYDHLALSIALKEGYHILPVFIFDTTILQSLPKKDRRVEFIHDALSEMQEVLATYGSSMLVQMGDPKNVIPELVQKYGIDAVFLSEDYEPYARARDNDIRTVLHSKNVLFHAVKDQVIFNPVEVLKENGTPYGIFTPYKNAWLSRFTPDDTVEHAINLNDAGWIQHSEKWLSLHDIGFEPHNNQTIGLRSGSRAGKEMLLDFSTRIAKYDQTRDFPAIKGPSYLSTHFRFGTISIREAFRLAIASTSKGHEVWRNELIWREFYMMVLWHRPDVVNHNYNHATEHVQWDNPKEWIEAWKSGKTGYPIVDAAQRQLLATGYMHNRLRMVTASFLTKHLGVDWRIGEAFFAQHLNDFDLSANNGGWQWAASTGCDAQPYFRVFNPMLQSEKFDPKGTFIDRYCPELKKLPTPYKHKPWEAPPDVLKNAGIELGETYPKPIVDHSQARLKAIARFK